jgi:hypothetical protein
MVVVRRRVECVRPWLRASSAPLRPWRIAALAALLVQAPACGEALAQVGGCARCGAPAPAVQAPIRDSRPQKVWRQARRETRPSRKLAMAIAWSGGSYTVCVRACDGAFFPVSYFGAASRSDSLEQICRAQCPNAEVALYSFPLGGTIGEAVSSTGEPYGHLPNAHKFDQSEDPSCSCRATGQSWAEALAKAEAKYGGHPHDLLVTVQDAERMSRPAQAPKAHAGLTDSGQSDPAAPVELDINGVDKKLSAATSAISRETSGIRDDAQNIPSFGLRKGETLEEKGPDGSTRRVRVLPAAF